MNTRPFLNSEYYESNSLIYKPSKSRVLLQGTVRSFGEKVMKLQCGCEWLSKISLRG